jgi:hypothetical protein
VEREGSLPPGSRLPVILNRTLPGAAHQLNKGKGVSSVLKRQRKRRELEELP